MKPDAVLEPAQLRQWIRYHRTMAEGYEKLLSALEPLGEGETTPNGKASRSQPEKGNERQKQRTPPESRVPLAIRSQREAAGITLTDLAKRLGFSASYVGQVESGAQKARPEVSQHWEQVLNEIIRERESHE